MGEASPGMTWSACRLRLGGSLTRRPREMETAIASCACGDVIGGCLSCRGRRRVDIHTADFVVSCSRIFSFSPSFHYLFPFLPLLDSANC